YKLLSLYPPPIIRIHAKDKGVGLTNEDIAIRSKLLTTARVAEIAKMKSWDDVKVKEMIAFFEGCGFYPWRHRDRDRLRAYLRGSPKYLHLKKAGTITYAKELTKSLTLNVPRGTV